MAHQDSRSRTVATRQPATLTALLQLRAAENGQSLAFAFLADGETVRDRVTYAELDLQARRIAGMLRAQGACGRPILLLYPPGLDYVAAFFGCVYSGAIAVPAYPPHRSRNLDRLRAILRDSGADVVLCTAAVHDAMDRMGEGAADLRSLNWIATDLQEASDVEPFCDTSATPDRVAFLQYTSGSTSTPRGVILSHGNLSHNAQLITQGFRLGEDSIAVFWLPLYHDMGLIGGVLQPMQIGRPSYLMAPATFLASPVRWLQAISTCRARISGAPNFAYDLCVDKISPEQREGLDLSCWTVAFNGAEPVRSETLKRFAEAYAPCGFRAEAIYPCYGLAEATLFVTGGAQARDPVTLTVARSALEQHRLQAVSPEDADARTLVSCGLALGGQRVAIVDPETLAPCPPDRPGEVWVAGPSVAQGYWQRPEDTSRAFAARTFDGDGPFMRTGDLGFLHADELYITGRIKDLIILRGRNLYPQDIEQTAEASHPALRNGCGAAFAVDTADGERLVYVSEVERTERNTPAEDVAAAVSHAVAEAHEVGVDAVVLLKPGSIPKTSSGKIQRHACRAGYLDGTLDVIGSWQRPADAPPEIDESFDLTAVPTAGEIRSWLIERIARKLRIPVDDLDPREPLARYGLDSLTAVQTAGELERWLGRPLSPVLVYDHPTIDALAEHLAAGKTPDDAPIASPRRPVPTADAVAVIGIGCRFPGAEGPAEFWRLLRDGVDAISEVPADRWNVEEFYSDDTEKPGTMNTRFGGFLKEVDRFDRGFFGIAPREAERMDPQQRILLETTWEALEDAGLDPQAGTRNVGVFVGISSNDYGRLQGDASTLDAYVGTGNALSIAANRISYAFDFRGPSLAIDTACSSSLVAIHLACQSIRRGESDLTVAAGVNLILAPELTVNFTRAGMMAPDGRCKAFDAAANGYVRSEGCGVVVLKPLAKALADGDSIYAVVRGSAVNQDGRSNGLTAPNRQSQEAVLRAAYEDAGVRPADVDLIEAHGTGTSLGDPIEALALGHVLGQDRSTDRPAWLGSVKTNIGHLESAAGVAGFVKTCLALKYNELPPSLHFNSANPHIPFEQLPLRVATERQPLLGLDRPTLAGVSSFGFGGTNAHVVLEALQTNQRPNTPSEDSHRLVVLSARTPEALRDVARRWIDFATTTDAAISDLAFTAGRRRGHSDHRLAIVAENRAALAGKLNAWLSDEPRAGLSSSRVKRSPRVVWVLGGQGPQWWGMGRRLLDAEPAFRSAVESADAVLRPMLGWSVAEELRTQDDPAKLDDTDRVQPLLFALQVGLAALWRSWGVQPAAVVGHSLGEAAAAYVAGALNLEDAAKIVYHRSRLQHRASGGGNMAAIGLTAEESLAALKGFDDRLALAAINGPKATVWSGDPDALEEALRPLAANDVFHRRLRGRVAFHSPQMDPLRAELVLALSGIEPKPAKVPFYSTVTGAVIDGEKLDAEYWGRNLRGTVQFAAAADEIITAGFDLFLELGPHGVLVEPLHQCLRRRKTPGTVLVSLHRGEDDRAVMLAAAGGLYAAGVRLDWDQIVPAGAVVPLPHYPWQRERCWYEAPRLVRNGFQHLNGLARSSTNGRAHEKSAEDDWLVRPTWEEITAPAEPTRLFGTWLVIAESDRTAARLETLLRDRGAARVIIASTSADFAEEKGRYRFNPAEPAHLRRLVREAAPSPADLAGVIHVVAPATNPIDTLSTNELAAAQERGSVGVLHLVQALTANAASPRVCLVTRGAQAVDGGEAPAVAAAPVWGLGRVLAREHPELRIMLADLDPTPTPDDFASLLSFFGAAPEENQIAVREGRLLAARLVPAADAGLGHAPALRSDGTYLVTGGLGGLGLQLAAWLVRHGAGSLVLTGRRGATPESETAIAGLRAAGANVVVAKADVADRAQIEAVFAEIDETLPPLRGVIHAAGVLDDGIALQQNRDRLWKVLAPKLLGGWHLHALSAGRKLDFFALFSSAASALGSPGQSNYAAANAALDGLAQLRRARGLPAISINWGPWSGAGMAARDGKADRLAHAGMGLIDADIGLELFGRLLSSPVAQIGVIPADWQAYRRIAGGRLPPLLSALAADDEPASEVVGPRTPSALNRVALIDVPRDDWQPIIEGQLREQAARVLRLAASALDIDQPLNNVGIDSLMAIELKNRIEADLGVAVPMVKFLEGPSVRDLAGFVCEQMVGHGTPETGHVEAEIDVNTLSDDQVDALLAELTAAEKGD
jgi:acyl transferase domain-containing protein/acyl-CoA synthetase (AMP-forming)/AMP-acid ligase II/acyl carrier protein